jgi:TRAP-type C4-dicarboxylate transport system substrate-binding protein
MLVSGEIQFYTLMGGILGNIVPVAEVQQVPFAFRSAGDAHRAIDGPLGTYLREEMTAKGIPDFPQASSITACVRLAARSVRSRWPTI